jgi:hypothetical protein
VRRACSVAELSAVELSAVELSVAAPGSWLWAGSGAEVTGGGEDGEDTDGDGPDSAAATGTQSAAMRMVSNVTKAIRLSRNVLRSANEHRILTPQSQATQQQRGR